VVVDSRRAIPIDAALGERGALIALAATARHAIADGDGANPELIVGHGVLGRLLARIAVAVGANPVVWETNPERQGGAEGYTVIHPDADDRRDYRSIYDVSGDPKLLDPLIGRLAKGGEICLAGFYEAPLSFAFAPAFMREARLRVAAEWNPEDLAATRSLIEEGFLHLDGLITHHSAPGDVDDAYRTAFGDPTCLKMMIDWRARA
jgi:3-hydroxyethyl bacteriochlorophyllide a dehydrogenase